MTISRHEHDAVRSRKHAQHLRAKVVFGPPLTSQSASAGLACSHHAWRVQEQLLDHLPTSPLGQADRGSRMPCDVASSWLIAACCSWGRHQVACPSRPQARRTCATRTPWTTGRDDKYKSSPRRGGSVEQASPFVLAPDFRVPHTGNNPKRKTSSYSRVFGGDRVLRGRCKNPQESTTFPRNIKSRIEIPICMKRDLANLRE